MFIPISCHVDLCNSKYFKNSKKDEKEKSGESLISGMKNPYFFGFPPSGPTGGRDLLPFWDRNI